MYLSMYLSVCLSLCLFVCLPVSVYLSVVALSRCCLTDCFGLCWLIAPLLLSFLGLEIPVPFLCFEPQDPLSSAVAATFVSGLNVLAAQGMR